MIKFLKWTLGGIAFLFFALVIWVSITTPNNVKPAYFCTFNVPESVDVSSYPVLEAGLKSEKGVSGCSVNPESKLAAIFYHTEETDFQSIKAAFENKCGLPVTEHVFPSSGKGCPYHAVTGWLARYFNWF